MNKGTHQCFLHMLQKPCPDVCMWKKWYDNILLSGHLFHVPGWCRYSCCLSSVRKLSTSSIALRRYRPFRGGRAFDMNLQLLQWIAGRWDDVNGPGFRRSPRNWMTIHGSNIIVSSFSQWWCTDIKRKSHPHLGMTMARWGGDLYRPIEG